MRQHLGAVYTLPNKGLVREFVLHIPREFYRHKVFSAALFDNLRQRRGITEYVGKPYHFAMFAEFVLKEFFSVKELSYD